MILVKNGNPAVSRRAVKSAAKLGKGVELTDFADRRYVRPGFGKVEIDLCRGLRKLLLNSAENCDSGLAGSADEAADKIESMVKELLKQYDI